MKLIEEVKKMGFGEILFFSPNSHDESWNFHDLLDFERVGEIIPPDDEIGQIWRKIVWDIYTAGGNIYDVKKLLKEH